MKVVIYEGEKKIREGQFFPNVSVRDVTTKNPPINPKDEDQLALTVEGGSPTAVLNLMFSVFLGGWVSSVNHPGLLRKNQYVRIVNEDTRVSRVA